MLLENYPEETERLKKHNRFFEWVTWLILIVSYVITFLPLGLPIHRWGINLIFVIVGLTTFIAYRVLPFEKRTGPFPYTYKQKGFSIQISDHVFASAVILFSGGIESPFWFVYLLALIAGAMYLPAWAIIVVGLEAITLYLFTVAFLTPALFETYEIGLTSQMLIVPMASFFAVIMTYVVAKDLNIEITNISKLAADLKKKTLEILGERNKLNAVVASVADGIFVLDKQGKFIFINKAAAKMLGLEDQNILNKSFDQVVVAMNIQDNSTVRFNEICPSQIVAEDKLLFGPTDLKIKTNKNNEIWVRFTSLGIREGSNIDIGCICTFHDVSKEKELEEMKLDFVAMAAHELRTPLTAVRGYLSILMGEVARKLNREERSWIERAFVSSTNLSALVENLLSISRIEMRSLKLELSQANWQKLLAEATENFRSQATQKNIDLSLKAPKDLPKVSVDKFRIMELLSNLLSNAISYTKPNGKVQVSAKKEDGKITTSIKDTGQGIPESAVPHLFTKFFRVSGVLEQGSKGTGLGLYISKAIVNMHGGDIWVESVLGKGSTFSFSIPIKPGLKKKEQEPKKAPVSA